MIKEKKQIVFVAGVLCFIVYFFGAARPIPPETVLVPRWLSSLESDFPAAAEENSDTGMPVPFTLGSRFGYVDSNGRFEINRIKKGGISLSDSLWSEYDAEPERVEIRNNRDEAVLTIDDPRGYPFFLDRRIFLLGGEQNALSEIDGAGNVRWTYEFAAPLTCVDAAAGLVLTGSIDGVVEVLDNAGKRVFFFEPGGSRYAVILGCAISRDGSRLGIISGVDDQRFLLLERFGGGNREYKVSYHEFLEDGFRRPVYIRFADQDRRIIFERQGGAGVYELSSRRGTAISLNGEIAAVEEDGAGGLCFVITSLTPVHKALVGIRIGNDSRIVMEAPFKSGDVFLDRKGSTLLVGGGSALISFELEKK